MNGSGIYAIVHRASGKLYVGSAVRLQKRWNLHRLRLESGTHGNRRLQAAWNKYGATAFDFEVVELCAAGVLLVREQRWIDAFPTALLYNFQLIAGSSIGTTRTPRVRRRISAALTGRRLSPSHRQHLSQAASRHWDGVDKQRWSNQMRSRMQDPITRAKCRASAKRRWEASV